jgi:hypothetical protein
MANEIDITDDIKKKCSELIRNGDIKTPEKARVVAGELLRRGVQPSWRLIRDILGVGSATTLQNAVNQYWNELGSYLDKLEKRPELPKTLVLECNAIWDNALQLAEKKAKNKLKEAFENAKEIEREIHIKNKELEGKLVQKNTDNLALEEQLQQLKHHDNTQKKTLQQTEMSLKNAKIQIEKNHIECKKSLKKQEKNHIEQDVKCKKSHHHLEQSLQKTKQQLVSEKSQHDRLLQQYQKNLSDLKQDRQNELDRQAKQYDSMIEYYSNEIGSIKVKLEVFEKNTNKERKQWQTQHETRLVAMAEQQAKLTVLSQQNKALEKENSHKASLLKDQQQELQLLYKESARLDARLEILTLKK